MYNGVAVIKLLFFKRGNRVIEVQDLKHTRGTQSVMLI
jgi:hypothetical protein